MNIARSTLYAEPAAAGDDTAVVEAISRICDVSEHYGWRRVCAALRQQGMVVNHKKVRRLMREHGLQPKTRRRHTTTTDSDHDQPIFRNISNDLTLDGLDQLWVADRTYVPVIGGFVYVAIILDAWSRRVVGYAMSRSIDARLTLAALGVAVTDRKPHWVACTIRIASRNMLPRPTVMNSPRAASEDRWGGAEIRMTMPRPKAS